MDFEIVRKLLILAYLCLCSGATLDDDLMEDNEWAWRWLSLLDPGVPLGRGSNHHRSMTNEQDVMWAREADQRGESLGRIADAMCVRKSTVYQIVCGDTWTHLPVLRPRPWLDDPVGYALSLCD